MLRLKDSPSGLPFPRGDGPSVVRFIQRDRGMFYPAGLSLRGAFYLAGQSLRLTSPFKKCRRLDQIYQFYFHMISKYEIRVKICHTMADKLLHLSSFWTFIEEDSGPAFR